MWVLLFVICCTPADGREFPGSGNEPPCTGVGRAEQSVEGRPLDEAELIGRAKNGDLDAYGELVRMHQAMALRVATLVVGDPSEAEDVTQDAFVKAHRHLSRFSTERPFRPWLLAIVRNEARNRRRSAGRRQNLELRTAHDPVSGDAAPSPEAVFARAEDRRRVLDALEGLPEKFRLAVACRYLLELSEVDTAVVLGIPVGTVKSRTARGLEHLRTALDEGSDRD
ncbi:MAG TPA: RNA polymerase sigma factor [Acidimicrobiia bacterium]|nr:RNA polymerase sigma factor [Acidimicrobiia bacterium]